MKKKFVFDQSVLKILYARYKPYLIYGGVILVCLIIVFEVIVPQVYDLLSTRDQVSAIQKRIGILNQNLNLLSNLNDSTLESQLGTTALALPPEKDFAGILNAIKQASVKSGAVVGDYSFQVGDITGVKKDSKKHPSMEINLTLKNDIKTTRNFLNEIYKTLPLSEVSATDISGNSAAITISFYYKQLPKIQFNNNMNIRPLSNQDVALIDKISDWQSIGASESSLME